MQIGYEDIIVLHNTHCPERADKEWSAAVAEKAEHFLLELKCWFTGGTNAVEDSYTVLITGLLLSFVLFAFSNFHISHSLSYMRHLLYGMKMCQWSYFSSVILCIAPLRLVKEILIQGH